MKRYGIVLVFLLAVALLVQAQGNPLGNAVVSASMPDPVFVFTADTVGLTWTGTLDIAADGAPILRITLPTSSAPLPRYRWTVKEKVLVGLGGLVAALLGGLIGHAL